jgi:hypothetical protein
MVRRGRQGFVGWASVAPSLAVVASSAVCACHRDGIGDEAGSGRAHAAELTVRQPAFPLRLSDDGRYLVDQTGRPFLIQGDAAWSLIARLRDGDVEAYLEDRRRRGFDAVLVNLLEHKASDHPPRNAYGDAPFARPGDFTTPNEAYFAHADAVLRVARAKGIAVLLAPAYLGQKGGDEGWYKEMLRGGPDALRGYGAYVARRYRSFDNVVWVLGGDYTPPPEGMAVVDALAEGIDANEPTGPRRHLLTAHWGTETSAQDVATSAHLDLNSTYTYGPVYEKSLADELRPGALPHFLIESIYEREHASTVRDVRAQAYYALLTGAVGQVFGNGAIWGFFPAWRGMLGSDGAIGMTNVRALFEPRAWTTLVPDARNDVLVAGDGSKGGNDHALLASSRNGALAIAYVPSGRDITVDLARLKTPLRARWYDPTNGTYADAAASADAGAAAKFQPPGRNHAGDPDWVLVLEALDAPP